MEPQPLVGAALTDDLVDDADKLFETETLFEAEALTLEAADLTLDLAMEEGFAVDLALIDEAFEAFEEISDLADFETELRLGVDTGIFVADGLDGDAVGEADGLLGFTELEAALEATADER